MTSLVFGIYIYWLWNVMNNWIEATSFSVGKHVAFELPALHSRAFPIGPWSVSSKVCYRGMGCVSTGCGILSFSDGPGEVLEFWFSEIWVDFQRISGVFIFHRIRPSSALVLARWGGSLHQLRSASSSLTQTRATMSEQIHRHTLTKSDLSVLFPPQRRWPPGHFSEVVWKHPKGSKRPENWVWAI